MDDDTQVKAVVRPFLHYSPMPGMHVMAVLTSVSSHYRFQIDCSGFGILVDVPKAVIVQARAPGNENPGYSDTFAVYVSQTFRKYINLKVHRVDKGDNPKAPVRFDILLIE